MSNKIGFWSVFGLVTVSQIGSGLMLPAILAPYGTLSLIGWILSGLGATFLAIMFSQLCVRFPRTGGPHVYVQEAFGSCAAFFTGWTYWVISWVSTIAIITSAVGYLIPLIGEHSPIFNLSLEIFIVLAITAINMHGVYRAGKSRFILVALKMIPLLVVPVIALFFFDSKNFTVFNTATDNISGPLNNVVLLTFWGFIGFESATAAVGEVARPEKTIPRAIILGTLFVALMYFISSLGIMGVIPGHVLMNSQAPYTDTILHLFGGYWHVIVSLIACLVCIAAVNAWTLASGQIAVGITQDGLMPKFFARKNRHGAPIFALVISCAATLPLLILTHHENLAQKVSTIIDFSVVSFLFVYIISCLSFLKIIWLQRKKEPLWLWGCGIASLGFCIWIICFTPIKILVISSLFVFSGLPIYLLFRNKAKYSNPTLLTT